MVEQIDVSAFFDDDDDNGMLVDHLRVPAEAFSGAPSGAPSGASSGAFAGGGLGGAPPGGARLAGAPDPCLNDMQASNEGIADMLKAFMQQQLELTAEARAAKVRKAAAEERTKEEEIATKANQDAMAAAVNRRLQLTRDVNAQFVRTHNQEQNLVTADQLAAIQQRTKQTAFREQCRKGDARIQSIVDRTPELNPDAVAFATAVRSTGVRPRADPMAYAAPVPDPVSRTPVPPAVESRQVAKYSKALEKAVAAYNERGVLNNSLRDENDRLTAVNAQSTSEIARLTTEIEKLKQNSQSLQVPVPAPVNLKEVLAKAALADRVDLLMDEAMRSVILNIGIDHIGFLDRISNDQEQKHANGHLSYGDISGLFRWMTSVQTPPVKLVKIHDADYVFNGHVVELASVGFPLGEDPSGAPSPSMGETNGFKLRDLANNVALSPLTLAHAGDGVLQSWSGQPDHDRLSIYNYVLASWKVFFDLIGTRPDLRIMDGFYGTTIQTNVDMIMHTAFSCGILVVNGEGILIRKSFVTATRDLDTYGNDRMNFLKNIGAWPASFEPVEVDQRRFASRICECIAIYARAVQHWGMSRAFYTTEIPVCGMIKCSYIPGSTDKRAVFCFVLVITNNKMWIAARPCPDAAFTLS